MYIKEQICTKVKVKKCRFFVLCAGGIALLGMPEVQTPGILQQPVVHYIPQLPLVLPQSILPAPMAMNWSYFKCEFIVKQEESLVAYLPRTIGWMNTQTFAADQGVGRFPLTIVGKARLLYKSMHPFKVIEQNCRTGLELSFLR